jgi:hypothetical protein
MSANTNRKRRAEGELGEEEGLTNAPKADSHYLNGIFAAQPKHFNAIWPGVRTEECAQLVFDSIKKLGPGATFEAILKDTGIDDKRFGIAIADLILWREDVATREVDGERVYVVLKDEMTKVEPEDREKFFKTRDSA